MSPHRSNDKQNAILAYIQKMIEDQGIAPTIDEIKTGCGLSTKSLVAYHLKLLERNGRIKIIPYLPRGIRLCQYTT
jgi:SOS-response transcriptional repressor LexA